MSFCFRNINLVLLCTGAAFLGGWLGWWAQDRSNPITVANVHVLTPSVSAGGTLKIQYDVIRHRSCELTVNRFIIDATNVRFVLDDTHFVGLFPLGAEQVVIPIDIPAKVSSGEAFYRSYASYICNPLQRLWPITVPVGEVRFVVSQE